MARLRYVGLTGSVGSGGLTSGATSHTFTAPLTYANGLTVPTLTGSDTFMATILDSTGANPAEVVQVTAYNQSTGAATIVRGQEGTSASSHASGDKVLLAAYPSDFASSYKGQYTAGAYAAGDVVAYGQYLWAARTATSNPPGLDSGRVVDSASYYQNGTGTGANVLLRDDIWLMVNNTSSQCALIGKTALSGWQNADFCCRSMFTGWADQHQIGVYDPSASTVIGTSGNPNISGSAGFWGVAFDMYNSHIDIWCGGTSAAASFAPPNNSYNAYRTNLADFKDMAVQFRSSAGTTKVYWGPYSGSAATPAYTTARPTVRAFSGGSASTQATQGTPILVPTGGDWRRIGSVPDFA